MPRPVLERFQNDYVQVGFVEGRRSPMLASTLGGVPGDTNSGTAPKRGLRFKNPIATYSGKEEEVQDPTPAVRRSLSGVAL